MYQVPAMSEIQIQPEIEFQPLSLVAPCLTHPPFSHSPVSYQMKLIQYMLISDVILGQACVHLFCQT